MAKVAVGDFRRSWEEVRTFEQPFPSLLLSSLVFSSLSSLLFSTLFHDRDLAFAFSFYYIPPPPQYVCTSHCVLRHAHRVLCCDTLRSPQRERYLLNSLCSSRSLKMPSLQSLDSSVSTHYFNWLTQIHFQITSRTFLAMRVVHTYPLFDELCMTLLYLTCSDAGMLPADGTGVVPAGTGDAAKRTHTLHLSGNTTCDLSTLTVSVLSHSVWLDKNCVLASLCSV